MHVLPLYLMSEEFQFFSIKNDTCCGLFIDGNYYVEKGSFHPYFVEGFLSRINVRSWQKHFLHRLIYSYDFCLAFYWCGVLCSLTFWRVKFICELYFDPFPNTIQPLTSQLNLTVSISLIVTMNSIRVILTSEWKTACQN